MTEKEALLTAIGNMSNTVRQLKPSHLDSPTPDSEWSVRDLLSHIIGEALWIPDILAGKTIEEVGDKYSGDVIGEDAKDSWLEAAVLAETAVRNLHDLDKTVHLSFGDVPARIYLRQMTLDFTIHAWDLAVAIEVNDELPPELVGAAWEVLQVEAEDWRDAGAFGVAVKVAGDAPLQTRLLALSGRYR